MVLVGLVLGLGRTSVELVFGLGMASVGLVLGLGMTLVGLVLGLGMTLVGLVLGLRMALVGLVLGLGITSVELVLVIFDAFWTNDIRIRGPGGCLIQFLFKLLYLLFSQKNILVQGSLQNA